MAGFERKSLRFDMAVLRELAGEKVFARGVAYHRDGQVEIVGMAPDRVSARVLGTQIYQVELTGAGSRVSGRCSCPAFSDWGFCKHMVAAALAANSGDPGEPAAASNRLSRIRAHLVAQGVEALANRIMGWAERDPELLSELDLAVTAEADDGETLLIKFRNALTEATRTGGYVEYADAGGWASRIERVLGQVEVLIPIHPDMALRLIDHAFDRLETALGHVDDSNGEGSVLLARIRAMHLTACRAAAPDPVTLARDLFEKETESGWDAFDGAAESHAEVLGEAGLAEYRRLAQDAWRKLGPRPPGRFAHDPEGSIRYRLTAILDGFATREGDLDARIALRANSLTSAYGYFEVAQICIAHHKEDLALTWAEEGLWRFEDQPDERLTRLAADLMRRSGQVPKADDMLWRAFEKAPSRELFRELRAGGDRDRVIDRATAILTARINSPHPDSSGRSSPRAIADLLIGLLTEEMQLGRAWEAVRAYGCGDSILEALARLSEASFAEEALSAYAAIVERHVARTSRNGYEAAYAVIRRMAVLRSGLGQDALHTDYVQELAIRHKAKRTFVGFLQDQEGPKRRV